MDQVTLPTLPANTLDPRKFQDPVTTAAGDRRAVVALTALDTLWPLYPTRAEAMADLISD